MKDAILSADNSSVIVADPFEAAFDAPPIEASSVGFVDPFEAAYDFKPQSVQPSEPTGFVEARAEELTGIKNAALNALDSSRQAWMAGNGLDANDAAEIARLEAAKASRPISKGYEEYQQAEGWGAVKAFAKNPVEILSSIIAEGLTGSVPAIASGLSAGAAGALTGSVVPVLGTGVGFTAGMVAGTGAGSFATEYGSKILEELQKSGMELRDPASIAKFFADETLMEGVKEKAVKRGIPVAAFDAVSAGIAGRIGSIVRAAAKTPARLAVTEALAQGALGGGGEVAGSLSAGDPVSGKAVFGEVVGELGPGMAEVLAGRKAQAVRPGSPQANAATDGTQTGVKPAASTMPVPEEIKAWLDEKAQGAGDQRTEAGGQPISDLRSPISEIPTTQPAVSFPAEQPGAQAASPATGEPALAPVAPIASPDNIYLRMPIERVQEDAKLGNVKAIEAMAVRQPQQPVPVEAGQPQIADVINREVQNEEANRSGIAGVVEAEASNSSLPAQSTTKRSRTAKQPGTFTENQVVKISAKQQYIRSGDGWVIADKGRILLDSKGNRKIVRRPELIAQIENRPGWQELKAQVRQQEGELRARTRMAEDEVLRFYDQDPVTARVLREGGILMPERAPFAPYPDEYAAYHKDFRGKVHAATKKRSGLAQDEHADQVGMDDESLREHLRKMGEQADKIREAAIAGLPAPVQQDMRANDHMAEVMLADMQDGIRPPQDAIDDAPHIYKDLLKLYGIDEKALRQQDELSDADFYPVEALADRAALEDAANAEQAQGLEPGEQKTGGIEQTEPGALFNDAQQFNLAGDAAAATAPLKPKTQETPSLFSQRELMGRNYDDLDNKGISDLQVQATRENVDLTNVPNSAPRIREAIREARRSDEPRNPVAGEIQGGADELFGPGAGKFRAEETAPPTFGEFTEQKKAEAIKLLNTILGDNVQVKTIAEKIMTPDGQAALGKYQAGWVTLVEGRADVKDTAAHEAVHAAVDMFLAPAERQRLLDAVDGNEEALAENFVQYAKDRSGAFGKVRIVAEKLVRIIRAFVTSRQNGVPADTVVKFYEDLMLGRTAKNAGQSLNSDASFRLDPNEGNLNKARALYEAAQGETDPVKLEVIRTEFRQIKALAEQVNGQTSPAASLNTPEKRKELAAMSREELQSEAKARGISPAGPADVIRTRIQNAQDGERVRARSFLQTVQNETGLPKELMERLAAVDPQTYQQSRTTEIFQEFRKWLDGGSDRVTQADAYVRSKDAPSATKGAMFAALLDKYQSEDNFTAEQSLVESFDEQLRESGRFIQASSLFASMSGKGFMKSVEKFLGKYKAHIGEDILESIRQDYIAATRLNDEAARMEAVAAVIERVASLAPTKWNDWISAYRYTNMLSNPRSHERNIWGNFFQTFVARPLALAGQGKVVGAAQYNTAAFKALPNAIQAFKDSWNSGSTGNRWFETMNSNMSKFESERMRQGAQAVPARKLLLVVGRLLEAQDKFFGALIAQGETYRLIQKGVSPEVAASAGQKMGDDLLYRDRIGSDMGDKTKAFGVRALDAAGYSLEQLRKTPFIGQPVGWFVPFLRTPINIGKRMVEFSPLGFVRNPTAGKMTAEQVGRAVAGSAVMTACAVLALSGQTTGAPPKDKEERRLWYASGRRPWSVLIGDKWVPMWFFGSFAGALALPAAVRDSWVDDPTTANAAVPRKLGAIIGSMTAFYGSQTPLQGVGTFLDIAMGRSDYTTATSMAFNAGQFVPASGFLRWANQLMIDPVYRRGGSFEEGFKKDYPFFSQQTRAVMGPEIKSPSGRVIVPAEPVTRTAGSTLLPYDVDAVNPEWDAVRKERNAEMKNRSKNNELVDADIRSAIKGDASPDQVLHAIGRMSGSTKSLREERSRLQQRAKSKFKDAGLTY